MKTKFAVRAIVLALTFSAPVFADPALEPAPAQPTSAEPSPVIEFICAGAPDCVKMMSGG